MFSRNLVYNIYQMAEHIRLIKRKLGDGNCPANMVTHEEVAGGWMAIFFNSSWWMRPKRSPREIL